MSPLIQHGLSVLYSPGQVVELRAIGDRVYSGYYTDYAKLALDAAAIESYPDVKGIYTTLNEVNPALLSRCANRIKKVGHKEPQTGDTDILRRTWLPIDIDPNRPPGYHQPMTNMHWLFRRQRRLLGSSPNLAGRCRS